MKYSLIITALLVGFLSNGQNLVPNSSFEDINYCETRIPCSPSAWYSVSNIPYGYQNDLPKPFDGKHSIAFLIAYEKEVRSYWQTIILCRLQAQQKYVVSFDLYPKNTVFQPRYIGVYLSDTLFRSKNDTIIQKNSTVSIDERSISSLKNGWYRITLSYTSTGGEKYFLLGNFCMDSNKEILRESDNKARFIEYYIDNVALKAADKNVGKCVGYKTLVDSLYAANDRHKDFLDNKPPQASIDIQAVPAQSKTDTLVLSKINFNFGSDKLVNTQTLNKYFDNIEVSKIRRIEIVGYTDSIGTALYNLDLSERRALSVKNYLINIYRLSDSIIAATGKGVVKDEKLLENNRRVEIKVYKR